MRYFELKTEEESKFWNIDIEGKFVIKSYGKTGSKGRDVKDEYADENFAKKDALKLIQKKFKEGYSELPSGDNDDEKWLDEKASSKTAKAIKKDAPAKSKEKRIPVNLPFVKTNLQIQDSFGAKTEINDIKIVASYICQDNDIAETGEVNEGLKLLDDEYLQAVSGSWEEVTDLFNLKNGTCCRITSVDERRMSGVLMDKNYFYTMAIKGFEAESRNLVKYDLDTNEIVWTCGSSSSSITPRFVQDEEYIYSSDVKMLYITSKTLGKTVAKVEVASKMDKKQKFYSNTSKRFVRVHKLNERNMVLCGSMVNIALVDPLKSEKIWEISSKKYEAIMASYICGGKLYILGKNDKLFIINIPDGKIENEILIKHSFKMERCAEFYLTENEFCTVFRDGNKRILLRIDLEELTYRIDDYTEFLPESGLFDPYEIIKDNMIISVNDNYLTIIEKNTGKKLSSLEIPKGKGKVSDFIVAGNYIYLVQKGDGKSSILHQIK
ncbi:MAG: WGR domain-containing protein [Prevotella sp.]|jgi:predicted DNA-binding WGR domain protein/ribosomal protein S17|nr:WGR domain-containing protein [Prevotella sp.]